MMEAGGVVESISVCSTEAGGSSTIGLDPDADARKAAWG